MKLHLFKKFRIKYMSVSESVPGNTIEVISESSVVLPISNSSCVLTKVDYSESASLNIKEEPLLEEKLGELQVEDQPLNPDHTEKEVSSDYKHECGEEGADYEEEYYDEHEDYCGDEEYYYEDADYYEGDYYYDDQESELTLGSLEGSIEEETVELDEESKRLLEELEMMKAMGLPDSFGHGIIVKAEPKSTRKQKHSEAFKRMYKEWSRKVRQLSSEELRNFDFNFDSTRDRMFVAKNAEKFFSYGKDDLHKYWNQRYCYFSKFDEGILLDKESWFSVTPERLASHIADRLVTSSDMVILDGFCGAGGNAIQFALKGAIVYAIDLDPLKLRFAKRNAEVYGVIDKINFICGDFFHVAESLKSHRGAEKPIDVVFLSPPWGGPSYTRLGTFSIKKMKPNGVEIFDAAKQLSSNIAYFLPRNTSRAELVELASANGQVEIEECRYRNKVKALNAYYGDLITTNVPMMKGPPAEEDIADDCSTSTKSNKENHMAESGSRSKVISDDDLFDNLDVV